MLFDLIAVSAEGPTSVTLLSWLLTTEGLLFAALTISVTLSASSTFGRRTAVAPAVLGFLAVGVLSTVAAAAVFSWTDLFLGVGWPDSWNRRIEVIALLFAIVVQPLLAVFVAMGVWRA